MVPFKTDSKLLQNNYISTPEIYAVKKSIPFTVSSENAGSTGIISFVNTGNLIKNCCWRNATINKRNIYWSKRPSCQGRAKMSSSFLIMPKLNSENGGKTCGEGNFG